MAFDCQLPSQQQEQHILIQLNHIASYHRYLTAFQMVQFIAIFIHQFQLLFRECNYPKGFMIWIGLHGVMFLFLFSDFYKVKYTKAKLDKASMKNGSSRSNGIANGVSSQRVVVVVVVAVSIFFDHQTHLQRVRYYLKDISQN